MRKSPVYILLLTVLLAVTLAIPVFAETRNQVISGDEIITYNMANNSDGGFVFSEGRVAGFLKENVIDKSFGRTVSNLIAQGMDVLKNRSRSAFFTYVPDPEVRYYTNDEMADWMEKRDYERFNLPTTWLHSVSDESNSYLYYSLMNIVCSLFPSVSGTKWSGFLLNYGIFLILLCAFYRLTGHFTRTTAERLFLTVLLGTTCDVITRICLIRAYLLAMTMVVIDADFHLRMWEQIDAGDKIAYGWIVPVTLLTIFSHYSTILCIGAFALVSLICFLKHEKKKEAVKYILLTILGGLIAEVLDPFSVAGLLIKFVSDSNGTAGGFMAELKEYCFVSLFPLFALIPLLAYTLYNRIIRKQPLPLSRYRRIIAVALICPVLIGFGMKSRRYLSIVTPLYVLLLGLLIIWNYRCAKKDLPAHTAEAVFTVFAALIVSLNIFNSVHSFDSANAAKNSLDEALAPYTDKTVVLMRSRRSAYEYVPEISSFDGCQVITVSSDNWEELVSDTVFKDEMVLITCGMEKDDIPTEWFASKNLDIQDTLVDGDGIAAYQLKRQ